MKFTAQTNQLLLNYFSKNFLAFHQHLANMDVASKVLSIENFSLTEHGIDFESLDHLITTKIQPALSGSNGRRYWGFVTGGANPVATYADWLVTTYNQNVSKGGDSIASAIERQTIDLLCQLFYLPNIFKGVITTGATAANFLGALTARQYAGAKQNIDVAKVGMKELSVDIYSATPHASMIKSLGMAGFGQNAYISVPCLENSEAINIEELANLLRKSKANSRIVIASVATVTGTDYDDLNEVSRLCRAYDAWLHVDAAFGIFDRTLNGPTGLTSGLEFADSITLDCHKWLNVPYDCGVFITKHQELLKGACHVDAPYLANDDHEVDFMSLGVENSRRFRAFPVWATLMFYGREGIKNHISANIKQAKVFAHWLEQSPYFNLVKPCQLNVVLFTPNRQLVELSVGEIMKKVNQSGQVLITPGQWQGEAIMRAALSNWSTEMEDVTKVTSLLEQIAKANLKAK